MNVAVLTSSRADYGIYLPLIKALNEDDFFNISLIVFGSHLSHSNGYTINQILEDGFKVSFIVESIVQGDSANSISSSIGLTTLKFAEFWNNHKTDFDLVFCLGDRYEMFSAVIAGVPYRIKFAHIHGGEETLGSTDNIFRHSITLASTYHFVSCDNHFQKVVTLTGEPGKVFNVGSISLEKLHSFRIPGKSEFLEAFGIDLDHPTILVTIHPETTVPEKNLEQIQAVVDAILDITDYQVILNYPNADVNGQLIRSKISALPSLTNNRVKLIENFGPVGYFSAMKYCAFMLGNSSSGIIESASFGKMAIDIGDRQKGRINSGNVIRVSYSKKEILDAVEVLRKNPDFNGSNIYEKNGTVSQIISIIKGL